MTPGVQQSVLLPRCRLRPCDCEAAFVFVCTPSNSGVRFRRTRVGARVLRLHFVRPNHPPSPPLFRVLATSVNLKERVRARAEAKMAEVMSSLMKHRHAGLFVAPVDPRTAPNYETYVTTPMDLGTIDRKLRTGG